ncbi:hypothetical protein NEOKW01_0307 [Nematocida sp. AWRm80]|nr:hypothetical protein NEOKW01_0307 [Nematocida sp. AWRm80]
MPVFNFGLLMGATIGWGVIFLLSIGILLACYFKFFKKATYYLTIPLGGVGISMVLAVILVMKWSGCMQLLLLHPSIMIIFFLLELLLIAILYIASIITQKNTTTKNQNEPIPETEKNRPPAKPKTTEEEIAEQSYLRWLSIIRWLAIAASALFAFIFISQLINNHTLPEIIKTLPKTITPSQII